MVDIFEKICPECGKKIISLYQKQLDSNFEDHMRTHKKKEVENVGQKPT